MRYQVGGSRKFRLTLSRHLVATYLPLRQARVVARWVEANPMGIRDYL